MKRVFMLGVLAPLAVCAAAGAACTSTADCLRVIEQAQRDTRTVTAAFTQVKHVSLLDEPIVSSGRFVFKRPDRVRLQIEKPHPATVIINGHDIHIPNLPERERQALAMAPVEAMFTQLGAMFTGSMQTLQAGFEVTAHDTGASIEVTLLPRQASVQQMFREIDLGFSGAELFATQIRLADALGDSLEITLHDVQRNVEVPDSAFDVGNTPAP
jgi:outer membrane lipoprotein-sorting protein